MMGRGGRQQAAGPGGALRTLPGRVAAAGCTPEGTGPVPYLARAGPGQNPGDGCGPAGAGRAEGSEMAGPSFHPGDGRGPDVSAQGATGLPQLLLTRWRG